jgi:hypothetical protein
MTTVPLTTTINSNTVAKLANHSRKLPGKVTVVAGEMTKLKIKPQAKTNNKLMQHNSKEMEALDSHQRLLISSSNSRILVLDIILNSVVTKHTSLDKSSSVIFTTTPLTKVNLPVVVNSTLPLATRVVNSLLLATRVTNSPRVTMVDTNSRTLAHPIPSGNVWSLEITPLHKPAFPQLSFISLQVAAPKSTFPDYSKCLLLCG